jgi:hypothetical protein
VPNTLKDTKYEKEVPQCLYDPLDVGPLDLPPPPKSPQPQNPLKRPPKG